MDNYAIADNFTLLSKLMDIHGENSFKSKSYASAAYTIEKLPAQLADLPADKISSIKGIGDAIAAKIQEQLNTGQLTLLTEMIARTPSGVVEMLHIKGLGPKKIATVWKDLEVENIGELLYACNENRLLLYKGFGAKTQQNIKESIEFYLGNQGSYLYAQIAPYAQALTTKLQQHFTEHHTLLTGDLRRHIEVITRLQWITTIDPGQLQLYLTEGDYAFISTVNNTSTFKGKENEILEFTHTSAEKLYYDWFCGSCSETFLEAWTSNYQPAADIIFTTEEAIFEHAGIAYIPPYLRESANILDKAKTRSLPDVIVPSDITAIIHSHSKWSDGVNTIEEMAKAAIAKDLQFLVLSDHSKTAFYANGLNEERLLAQHEEIDALNQKYAPFKIFKSIESDILNDGSLDYAPDVLASFDVVIASVHANLKMNQEKAMMRLLRAIENPYTSILGHMTGRLLLSRNGYPVDHAVIIDACAANNVVIEINAHPRRLDIDWRWVELALEKGVLLSINPDAHSVDGYDDVKYGVLAGQKGGLQKHQNLSSFSLEAFEAFVSKQQAKRR
ncbi:DNA polymerase/3'-5' exonuclease PolX [Deminuibacter soli]|uniref:DNA polymerase/3'-5' exonuclease PolX n=2 Tax=Deminuibacter soli TaxID=2291815 RepID=A0A3E1NMW1_9BACT|nr:DNA polymerase/3'-5' exonuclease PolX [Deminuibacter soli]